MVASFKKQAMTETFPCPACGFLTFDEPPGIYNICSICGWEDDHVQLAHPRLQGGANKKSLCETQIEELRRHPLVVQEVDGSKRDPLWRPATDEEAAIRADAPTTGNGYFEATVSETPDYYWRRGIN